MNKLLIVYVKNMVYKKDLFEEIVYFYLQKRNELGERKFKNLRSYFRSIEANLSLFLLLVILKTSYMQQKQNQERFN